VWVLGHVQAVDLCLQLVQLVESGLDLLFVVEFLLRRKGSVGRFEVVGG
jgi:hypothetical protein